MPTPKPTPKPNPYFEDGLHILALRHIGLSYCDHLGQVPISVQVDEKFGESPIKMGPIYIEADELEAAAFFLRAAAKHEELRLKRIV